MPVLVPVNHGNGGSDEPSRSLEPETAARNGSSPAATSSTYLHERIPRGCTHAPTVAHLGQSFWSVSGRRFKTDRP
jgi:hypothetical protein